MASSVSLSSSSPYRIHSSYQFVIAGALYVMFGKAEVAIVLDKFEPASFKPLRWARRRLPAYKAARQPALTPLPIQVGAQAVPREERGR